MSKGKLPVESFCITTSCTVRDAVQCIDRSGRISLALLVDDNGCLLSVLTDGDIRRGLLRGISLDAPVSGLLEIKAAMPNAKAVTAAVSADPGTLLKIMQERGVRQLPLVDEQEKVVDVVLLRDLLPEATGGLQAVVMAGGFGTRLRPFTDQIPKPMLPVAGRPLMERIIEQLRQAGIRRVNVSTHYKAEKIVEHFGDGNAFGVSINYVNEDTPLGTGGALGLMPPPDTPVLVVNGDILTGIDYRQMLEYHQDHKAAMTVAVNVHTVKIPYGVIECDGARITSVREKPELRFFVNAGIYLLEPEVYKWIPSGEHFNMTDLIERMICECQTVVSFPIREYWLDIGHPDDYRRAQADAETATGQWGCPPASARSSPR